MTDRGSLRGLGLETIYYMITVSRPQFLEIIEGRRLLASLEENMLDQSKHYFENRSKYLKRGKKNDEAK